MMLSCKEVTRRVSQGEDRQLALGERLALQLHFAICRGCRRAGEQLRFLRRAVRKLSELEDGSAG
jgi:hypothetical protein